MTIPQLRRPFVRLWRIRHRRGYGVHSPSAFDLLTQVVYERTPYYKYKELRREERQQRRTHGADRLYEPLRVKRLLFRLVNYVQPHAIFDVGRLASSALYLKAAATNAEYTAARDTHELFLEPDVPVDFLYLHDYRHPAHVESVFNLCADRVSKRSLFVIEGVGYTRAMRRMWKRMQRDERTAVTFDLYDVGLIFFDHSKTKQHYIINF
ncbi:MAG: hypothetical protein LBN06_00990 [Prevotellaceae bacterium]|jgi:hypothetical protein|nr:hypothetical protein [Prevotellaceae bacterium]